MLSRKEFDKSDIEDKSGNMAAREAPCLERHLEELPGYVEVEILFDKERKLTQKPYKVSLPVCYIQMISNKDEVIFEKILLKNENYQKNSLQEELNLLFSEFEGYQKYIQDPKTMSELMLDEAKMLLNKIQHGNPAVIENIMKHCDDNEENLSVK